MALLERAINSQGQPNFNNLESLKYALLLLINKKSF
jgi:hypothetical protein